jgi:L-lactate dehydrogenase
MAATPAIATAHTLLTKIADESHHTSAKVTIVGTGQVGMAAAFALMTQGVVSELALVDMVENKLKGEMMDLQHGQAFLRTVKVVASTDYAVSKGSKICIVTAGARQNEGESRLSLVQRNVEIFKRIIPNLVRHSPGCILVIVSNPVDIMTYVSWKLSGLPFHKVIGSGTMLDSSRFRFQISERLNIAPKSCHGYVIGEHGDSSVAVWSSVNVAGTRLRDISPLIGKEDDPENWAQVHKDVINSAYEIIRLKGYTNWSIGIMVSTLCQTILKNQRLIYTLSTLANGFHEIKDDVFISLPVVVGESGITSVFNQKLSESETQKILKSAMQLREIITGIKL